MELPCIIPLRSGGGALFAGILLLTGRFSTSGTGSNVSTGPILGESCLLGLLPLMMGAWSSKIAKANCACCSGLRGLHGALMSSKAIRPGLCLVLWFCHPPSGTTAGCVEPDEMPATALPRLNTFISAAILALCASFALLSASLCALMARNFRATKSSLSILATAASRASSALSWKLFCLRLGVLDAEESEDDADESEDEAVDGDLANGALGADGTC